MRRAGWVGALLLGACFEPGLPTPMVDTFTPTGTSTSGPPPTTVSPSTSGIDPSLPPTDGSTTMLPPEESTSTGDDVCGEQGCPCDTADTCDPGFYCEKVCLPITCGDELVHEGEDCDDGNNEDGDGCDNDCSYTEIVIDVSYLNACALIEGGRVRCWGRGSSGQNGYGNTDDVGDDELPYEVGDVQLPAGLLELHGGDNHTCGRLDTDTEVICWGAGFSGAIGTGDTEDLGDDEFLTALTPIDVGDDVAHLTTGGTHTCVETSTGQVRCWGAGFSGQLGYGNQDNIGDNEVPAAAGNVQVGAAIVELSAGIGMTCVIQSNGAVRCWGSNFSGQLGYGNTESIGDNETPEFSVTPLDFGDDAVQITTGLSHACALFENGDVRCWGDNFSGQLGQGHTDNLGDTEVATTIDPIDFGEDGEVTAIAAGDDHTCALFDDGVLKCWGRGSNGELGLGDVENVGDNELPSESMAVDLDLPVIQFDAGGVGTCAVLEDYRVYCWGGNFFGELGLGHLDPIGDDELPSSVEPVQILDPPP